MTSRPKFPYTMIGCAILVVGCTDRSETQEGPSQEPEYLGVPAWIGLYTTEQLGWLENENRLTQICGARDATPNDEWTRCANEARQPKTHTVPVYDGPSADAPRLGEIETVATPGQGLTVSYRPSEREPIPFTPDLYLQDWGYGPYFHLSVLTKDENWVMLPADPFARPVWMDVSTLHEYAFLEPYLEQIVTTGDGDWVILGFEHDGVWLRPEQPADMWCGGGDPPPLQPTDSVFWSGEDLRDERDHLTIRPKYMKGC